MVAAGRTRGAVCLLLAAAVTLGCTPTPEPGSAFLPEAPAGTREPAPDEDRGAVVVVRAGDHGRVVHLTVGDHLDVVLEENPTTGYTWEPEGLDARVLRATGRPSFVPHDDATGSGGISTRRYLAVAPGRTELRLGEQQPWTDEAPIRTFAITVEVEEA